MYEKLAIYIQKCVDTHSSNVSYDIKGVNNRQVILILAVTVSTELGQYSAFQ